MQQLTIGLTAHVDAGKTTLAEALLARTGEIRTAGRVDHGNTLLDSSAIERQRGITIFAHQAAITVDDTRITLLDTPGHIDFAAEAERTMQVLDYAVLVISGTDGVQSHTRTLWELLRRYNIPVILFINKMDISDRTENALLQGLQAQLSPACVRFDDDIETFCEDAAACSEDMMETFFASGTIPEQMLRDAIARREIFPCCFGAARAMKGIDRLIAILRDYTQPPPRTPELGATVFKISVDTKGNRLTYLKLRGGTLRSRDEITYMGADRQSHTEKITGIRYYAGAKFTAGESAEAGVVCAVTGLSAAYAGMGLGCIPDTPAAILEPVMQYRVVLPEEVAPIEALAKIRLLEAEDPQLHVHWDEHQRAVYVQLMGAVQLEVLTQQIADRFGYAAAFDSGMVTYRETIAETVEGIGHYEPLRHYAEVHLILAPLPAGSGLQFDTVCSEDVLDRNWQRLILTHLREKTHIGALTGSPITDMKLTLVSGKAHLKHTEGGDFRQATYRAVRHGLRSAKSVLLEPYYDFTLELPADCLGRAMTDIGQRAGRFDPPELFGGTAVLTGSAPVATLNDYAAEVASYTKGNGTLMLSVSGYRPCHNTEEIVAAIGYDPDTDTENSADSIFCSHGAGFVVSWQEIARWMHQPACLPHRFDFAEEVSPAPHASQQVACSASDDELMAIYERTYGKIQREERKAMRRNKAAESLDLSSVSVPDMPQTEYLLVDGYNIIFAWDQLKELAAESLDAARERLVQLLSNYQGYRKCELILVFDAYRCTGHHEEVEQRENIQIVYTREAETADSYIERVSRRLIKSNRVRVATSDALEQLIILGHGAIRISAREFEAELHAVECEIRSHLRTK